MSVELYPDSAAEVAAALAEARGSKRSIAVFGANSKRLMGGPCVPADISLSTSALNRVLQYEPHDLTVSIEAGMRWSDLQNALAREGQMVALDPPFAEQATVGGVVASNTSGPMRKLFGTARDLVIGMQFATLEGKLVQTGGMVVKNVAGLDMGKLLIGSFGTLAVITSVNFRLHLRPQETETFLFAESDIEKLVARRDQIVSSHLRPLSLDALSPAAASRFGRSGYLVAVRAGGSPHLLARYRRELSDAEHLIGDADQQFWFGVREFASEFLNGNPDGVILRLSTPLAGIGPVLRAAAQSACISRAGTGVSYVCATSWDIIPPLLTTALEQSWAAVVEFAPADIRSSRSLWPPGSSESEAGFAMMKKVKLLFDEDNLLNRSRLYGRI